MFTGIINYLGKVANKTDHTLTISTDRYFLSKIQKGDSVSINGICLTATYVDKQCFKTDFMPETENLTNIRYLKQNNLINLELPVTPTSFLSGHILQGHIDETSKLLQVKPNGNSQILKFSISVKLARFLVEKGSVAINGVSLTIIKTGRDYFTVGIIPYTWDNTMLKTIKIGDSVNIEVDILAKYLSKLIKK